MTKSGEVIDHPKPVNFVNEKCPIFLSNKIRKNGLVKEDGCDQVK